MVIRLVSTLTTTPDIIGYKMIYYKYVEGRVLKIKAASFPLLDYLILLLLFENITFNINNS